MYSDVMYWGTELLQNDVHTLHIHTCQITHERCSISMLLQASKSVRETENTSLIMCVCVGGRGRGEQ